MYKEFDEKTISEIEKAIGYSFRNKQLLVTAFTHSSFSNENLAENNEKLEFLGDSLLNFIVSEFLYGSMKDEGALTTARAKIVSAAPLASAVQDLKLMRFMRLSIGVSKEKLSQKFYSNIFEAVAGAIYLDGGMHECKKFISNNLDIDSYTPFADYKTKLQEYVQRSHDVSQIIYKDSFDEGDKMFLSAVYVCGEECGSGKGIRKKVAQQNAARAALEKFNVK